MAENINININAKDNASTTISKVKTNLAGLSTAATTAQKGVSGLGVAFGNLKGVLAGLAIGNVVAGAFRLADGMVDLSNATNLSTQSILAFSNAVALNGGDLASAQNAITRFSQVLGDAKNGVKSAEDSFAKLGISLTELRTLSEEDLLRQTVQGLGNIDDAARRSASAVDVFGRSFAGVDIATVNEQYAEFTRQARENAAGIEAAGRLQGSFNDAITTFQQNLLTVLTPLNEFLATILENKDNVKKLSDAIIGVGTAIAVVFGARAFLSIFKGISAGITGSIRAMDALDHSFRKTRNGVSGLGKLLDRLGRGVLGSRGGGTISQFARQFAFLAASIGPVTIALGAAAAAGAYFGNVLRKEVFTNEGRMERFAEGVRQVREEFAAIEDAGIASQRAEEARVKIQELTAEYERLQEQQQRAMTDFSGIGADLMVTGRLKAVEEELDYYYDLRNVARLRAAELQETVGTQGDSVELSQQELEIEREKQRLAEEQAQEAARQMQNTIDTIAGLKEELMLLGLTERQQAIYNATKEAGTNATIEELAQISALAGEIFDLTQIREQDAEATQQQAEAQAELNAAINNLAESYQEAISAAQEFVQTKQAEYEFQNMINTAVGVQRDYLEEMAEFDRERISNLERLKVAAEQAAAAGVDGAMDQYNAAVAAYEAQRELFSEQAKQQAELQNSFAQGWKEAIATIADSFTPYEMAQQSIQAGWGAISNAVDDFTKTGKFKIKDFALSAIADITSMVLKAQLLKGITGGLGLFGIKLPGLASGGPAQANKPYIVGEQGPELFVPKSSGTVVPNGASMGGSAQVTNNYITNNINAVDAKSVAQLFVENRKTLLGATMMARKEMPYGMA